METFNDFQNIIKIWTKYSHTIIHSDVPMAEHTETMNETLKNIEQANLGMGKLAKYSRIIRERQEHRNNDQ
jgi:hypothetical protein